MGRMILSKRFWPAILLLWLPLVLLLAVLVLRDLLPLPQGAHRYDVYVAGDFAINSYRTPKGQYYDLTMTREGRTVVLVDRVYAYGKETGLLYVRGVTGAAAIDPRTGACTLYTEEYFPKYGRLAPGVQRIYSLNSFSQEDRAQLNQLTARYAAYPASADALATLGCGRFRIQQVTGKDGYRRLQLIDGLAQELDQGYTVRLLRDVQSYLLLEDVLYVRSREGYACLRASGENFILAYDDYGSKIYYSLMPDIEIERNLSAFPIPDRWVLQNLWFADRV